ncbi:oxalate:formate antiporter [Trinickia sp. LjRoot230]
MSQSTTSTVPQVSRVGLALFWAYVLIPLAWGVVNTLRQAMKLFREHLIY